MCAQHVYLMQVFQVSALLAAFVAAELLLSALSNSSRRAADSPQMAERAAVRYTPPILRAVSDRALSFFLVANVSTGIVNLTVKRFAPAQIAQLMTLSSADYEALVLNASLAHRALNSLLVLCILCAHSALSLALSLLSLSGRLLSPHF